MARILIVDDEPLIRAMLQDELLDAGHEVAEAASGDEAVSILGNAAFDLVVTDIRMPGAIDGWGLGELATRANPDVRLIYITGYCDTVKDLRPNERFLAKPFLVPELVALFDGLGIAQA